MKNINYQKNYLIKMKMKMDDQLKIMILIEKKEIKTIKDITEYPDKKHLPIQEEFLMKPENELQKEC